MWRGATSVLCLGMAAPAWGLDLSLPNTAQITRQSSAAYDGFSPATGAYSDGQVPTIETEGHVTRTAWRIETQNVTTLQLLAPLRAQVEDAGFELLYECHATECGGFDFRFNVDVMPAPDMYVDLFDYRYLAARKEAIGTPPEVVSIMVSRSSSAGYIQINTVTAQELGATDAIEPSSGGASETAQTAVPPPGSLALQMIQQGHVVLGDLEFESGSSSLAGKPYQSLQALAAFLKEDTNRRVALVGHTDAVGALDTNVVLSRRRAASVLKRLVEEYGIPDNQLEAGGMGYLAPIAPNLTPEGREANRRVEAVLLNVE